MNIFAAAFLALIPFAARAADTLYINANIHTMDADQPRAEAMLVREGLIAGVGSEIELRRALNDAPAQIVDLGGRTVLPGLIDAHGHLQGLGAFGLGRLELSSAKSFEDVTNAVREKIESAKAGEWIRGGRWDHESWNEKVLPRHAMLSAASPDNPVWLRRVDGHAGIANAAAMKAAGVMRETKSPAGGEIIRDASGEPTGVFIDNAMELVTRALPDSGETTEDLLLKAQEMCFSAGLTGVHDMGVSPAEIEIYKKLAAAGKLKLRVYALVSAPYAVRWFEEHERIIGDTLTVRAVKVYADGAMGSRGAWMLEPYTDRPTDDKGAPYTGLAVSEPSFIEDIAKHALEKGYQVCTHAIGDRANRETLDAYERALASRQPGDRRRAHRFRIEHAQLLSPADIPRFARLGVIASMQPTHCTSDMRWVEARVGAERAKGAYAWASLARSGATLAFGSDFPVESHNPFLGFHAAITRQNAEGQPPGGWFPDERISREGTLRAMTWGAAYASFEEEKKGSLRAGRLADFIVIDRDIMMCEAQDILATRVVTTVVGGETVYRAER